MIVYWEKNKDKEKKKDKEKNTNNLEKNIDDNNLKDFKNIEQNIININDFIENLENLEDNFNNQSFISNKSFNSFFNDSFDNIKKENEDFIEKENIIKIQNNKNIYNIDYCNDENIYLNNENINLKIYKTLPIEEKKMFINKNSKFLLLSQIGSEFLINIIYSERLEIINIILYLIIEKFSLYKNNNFTKNIIKALYTSNNYFILKNLLLSNINL